VAKSTTEILAWVAQVFEAPVEKISLETKMGQIDNWDSMGVLTLMARMDEDFQILLTEEEIEQMRSVRDILDVLRKHGQLEDKP
jgi:acyl carrier protein